MIIILLSVSGFSHKTDAEEAEFLSEWTLVNAESDSEDSKDTPQPEPVNNKEEPVISELAGVKKKEKLPPTSFALIREELDNKKISEQEAMILRLLAGFTPDELPLKYIKRGQISV